MSDTTTIAPVPTRPSQLSRQTIPAGRRLRPNGRPVATTRPPAATQSVRGRGPVRTIRIGAPISDMPRRPVVAEQTETLQDPTQIAATVVRAAVEVLDGRRPLHHIRHWLTPEVALQLGNRAQVELSVPVRSQNRSEPLTPIRIRRVHLVRFGDSAEATVILDTADRVRAAAARLEAVSGTWRISVLEIA